MHPSILRVETHEPNGMPSRQIAPRKYGMSTLAARQHELDDAITTVVSVLSESARRAAEQAESTIDGMEVEFNVAFANGSGVYLCSSADGATFKVKLAIAVRG